MHYINIHNKSGHTQRFQCHGYHGDKDIIVAAHSKAVIPAADGTHGAIIAVHDGVIGEQAEITKAGFEGNDTIDISNIVGAGGNITVKQIGEKKVKGHPLFMQACNQAWHKASSQTKNAINSHVVLDNKGNVKRIGPPKESQALEKFVRSFANCRTYIGTGAWGPDKGNPCDNKQSEAGKGSKDILITYNDGDASPDEHPHLAHRIAIPSVDDEDDDEILENGMGDGTEPLEDRHSDTTNGDTTAYHTTSATITSQSAAAVATDTSASPPILGPGIILTNKRPKEATFYFYENYWNGNGTAGANFDHPLKSVKLKPNGTSHVSLGLGFKGRVQHGKQQPATWVEFQIQASNDGAAHGDISLEQGCDGAATIASTDGHQVSNGFTKEILHNAPAAAVRHKPNGEKALASTMGNWMYPANKAAADYEYKELGHGKAYITGGTGVPDVASHNNVLAVHFY